MSIPFVEATLAEVQSKIAQFAAVGKLFINAWMVGDPAEQFYQAISRTIQYYTAQNATVVRGFVSLDTATDPGDEDPYSPGNAALDPVPGFLSYLGENNYYTFRILETYATTSVTFENTTAFSVGPFAADSLTFSIPTHPEITYRNSAMPSLYTGPGGTLTVLAGQTVTLDIEAESPGSLSKASPGEITVLVGGALGVNVTNPGAAIGNDRENAPNYRQRCREQAASVSPNGHADAYRYLSRTNANGTPLLQSLTVSPVGDGATAVSITRLYVSQSSTTGIVTVYFADDDGASSAVNVATANENITLNVIAVPDCVTYSGLPAVNVPITVTWAVKYRAKYLGQSISGAVVKAAIGAALEDRFANYPIGGFDQTAGAGTIYAADVRAVVERAHPAIYTATLSSPAGDTALALGRVAVLTTPTGTETAG